MSQFDFRNYFIVGFLKESCYHFLIVQYKQEVLSPTKLDCKHYLMGKLFEGWKEGMKIWLMSDSVLLFPAGNKIPPTNQSSANALFDKFCFYNINIAILMKICEQAS